METNFWDQENKQGRRNPRLPFAVGGKSPKRAAPNGLAADLEIAADADLGEVRVHDDGVVAGAALPGTAHGRRALLALGQDLGRLRAVVGEGVVHQLVVAAAVGNGVKTAVGGQRGQPARRAHGVDVVQHGPVGGVTLVDSPPSVIVGKAERNRAIFKAGCRRCGCLRLPDIGCRRTAIVGRRTAGAGGAGRLGLDRDLTLCRHAVYIHRNRRRAVGYGGDAALGVHGGNGLVAAGEGHVVGPGFFRGDGVSKLRRALGLQGQGGITQINAFDRGQNRDPAHRRKVRARDGGGDVSFARRHGCDLARVADCGNGVVGRGIPNHNMGRVLRGHGGFQRGGLACGQGQRVRGGDVRRCDNDLHRLAGGDGAVLAGQRDLCCARLERGQGAEVVHQHNGGVAGGIAHIQRVQLFGKGGTFRCCTVKSIFWFGGDDRAFFDAVRQVQRHAGDLGTAARQARRQHAGNGERQ